MSEPAKSVKKPESSTWVKPDLTEDKVKDFSSYTATKYGTAAAGLIASAANINPMNVGVIVGLANLAYDLYNWGDTTPQLNDVAKDWFSQNEVNILYQYGVSKNDYTGFTSLISKMYSDSKVHHPSYFYYWSKELNWIDVLDKYATESGKKPPVSHIQATNWVADNEHTLAEYYGITNDSQRNALAYTISRTGSANMSTTRLLQIIANYAKYNNLHGSANASATTYSSASATNKNLTYSKLNSSSYMVEETIPTTQTPATTNKGWIWIIVLGAIAIALTFLLNKAKVAQAVK